MPNSGLAGPRWLWVFEVFEQPDSGMPCVFSKYMATEYNTDSVEVAMQRAIAEYGYVIRGAQRRELTFPEYCALLRCNNEGEHNQRVWQAMLKIVFTGSLASVGKELEAKRCSSSGYVVGE